MTWGFHRPGWGGVNTRLSPVVSGGRTRGDGDNLKSRKFHLNIDTIFFPMWFPKHWMKLPVEFMVFSSLDTSKGHLSVFLGHVHCLTLL